LKAKQGKAFQRVEKIFHLFGVPRYFSEKSCFLAARSAVSTTTPRFRAYKEESHNNLTLLAQPATTPAKTLEYPEITIIFPVFPHIYEKCAYKLASMRRAVSRHSSLQIKFFACMQEDCLIFRHLRRTFSLGYFAPDSGIVVANAGILVVYAKHCGYRCRF